MKIQLPKQFSQVKDRALLTDLESRMTEVESRIQAATSHAEPLINKMSSHLSRAGGKRMRPVLVLLTSHLGDKDQEHVLDAAVVMEITHLATLYHDDVMDQANARRGVETAHLVWGNNVAILTGDLLFARASNIVSGLGERALSLQAKVFEQLVLGQLHETVGPNDGEDPLSHYLDVLRDKTGSLIALSARLGAMLAGADEKYQEPLQLFGERIGVAFQLADDLIDIRAKVQDSGKVSGTDLLAGVPTLPVLLLSSFDDEGSKKLAADIEAGISNEQLPDILERLRQHPAMELAQRQTMEWAERAIAAIEPLPEGSVKDALVAFARAVVERKG
ncbi:MAG: polyprenyl synthetase family protein [Aquiluna sp.]|uniref:polyprenyl synthetase family protein n=1 Tax=Aquiluna sp. TaxID=2053504 RepID=UPI00277A0740|nr:polyprenyl synthetase family protein [Aquiluna sp.]MDP4887119.1 polyprenyl synthetase family protein [Aquiluna sp.]